MNRKQKIINNLVPKLCLGTDIVMVSYKVRYEAELDFVELRSGIKEAKLRFVTSIWGG